MANRATQKLDKNTFFIYNCKWHHAKLAQWGTENQRDCGTYEQRICPDQLWYLEESFDSPGYYYINNAKYEGYRLSKWGPGDEQVGVFNGQYYRDHLWKFQKEGDYYRIFNKKYTDAKIAKWGKGDSDWGTWTGPDRDDQLWRLVPRFEARASEHEIWAIDNRQGSMPVTKDFTITTGVKLTESSSVSTKIGFEYSLKSSLSVPIEGITEGMESTYKFSSEISTSMSSSEEKSWSKSAKTTYTAPAGKTYRVLQTVLDFSSELNSDDCALYCNERIEESS